MIPDDRRNCLGTDAAIRAYRRDDEPSGRELDEKMSGYNKARDAALEMGKNAFVAGNKRNCFCDPAWETLYKTWRMVDPKRANRLGEQWYRGWDRANCRAMIES